MTTHGLRDIYPDIVPYKEHTLAVDDTHKLYVAEYGNPNGISVIYCHGGPGAGSQPKHARYFNPDLYHIVLFDQRGAGKSTPKSHLEDNTTQHLVDDMEKIREHLNIDRWVVGGGSWGSTLSLVYAETYPDNVLSLLLRGVFLGREEDCIAHLYDGSPASLCNYPEWTAFKNKTQALLEEANLTVDNDDYIAIYDLLLNHSNPSIRRRAASALSRWELENASLAGPTPEDIAWCEGDDGVNMGLTEIFYMSRQCFLDFDQILADADRIAHIPTHIVHGKYDLVCPAMEAELLAEELTNVTVYRTIAGHSGSEPETVDAMVKAADTIVEALALAKA